MRPVLRHALTVAVVAVAVTAAAAPAVAETNAPVITSTDYPEDTVAGGPGVPGTFSFAAPIPDVAAYRYSIDDGPTTTTPATADGTATVTITPRTFGDFRLHVYAITTAGDVSHPGFYRVRVNPQTPELGQGTGGPVPEGTLITHVLVARQPGAVEFVYRTKDIDPTVVPVVDGQATVTFTATDPYNDGYNYIVFYTRTAAGYRSSELYAQYTVT
jgi:hypothetical protein